jgi:outer membrane protein OmpA-like peptidoglycan-associated protein
LTPTSSEPDITPGDRQQSKAHHAVTTPPKIEVGDRDPADKRQGMGEISPLPLINEKIMIHFTLNSNEIEAESYAVLDRIARYLAQNPDRSVNVRGYTDASGSSGYNESVSRFRASAVKSYLVGKGASADNILIFAMGSSNPVASNETAEGRRQNRRVEIEFSQVETLNE